MDMERAGRLLNCGERLTTDSGAREEFDALLRDLEPAIRSSVHVSLARFGVAMRRSRISVDDVVQHVLRKLFEKTPSNPNRRDPSLVLRCWIRVVATRAVLDGMDTEPLDSLDDETDGRPALISRLETVAPAGEDVLELKEDRAALRQCIERLPDRPRRCVEILFEDPDVSGPTLAEELDIWTGDPAGGPTKQQINLAHRVRSDAKKLLVSCLRSKGAFAGAFR